MRNGSNEREVVLICGVSGGLGQVLARTLLDDGFEVFGTMRSPAEAEDNGVRLLAMDITKPDSVSACLKQVQSKAGRIDAVINCANELVIGSVEELSVDEVRRVYDINVLGLFSLFQSVVPIMRRQGGGTIITMSSLGGILAAPFLSAYTSSKFAVEALAEALHHEVASDNIDIVIMQPTAMAMDRPAGSNHVKISAAVGLQSRSQLMIRKMIKDSAESDLTPDIVAGKIRQILRNKRRKLRYPMGRARLLGIVKRFAPQSVIDGFIARVVAPVSADPPPGFDSQNIHNR